MVGNNAYSPSCATNCSANTLDPAGDTNCVSKLTVAPAEINELYLDQKSTTLGVPLNPVATYTAGADNSAGLTTWRTSAVDNTAAGKVRVYYGQGEKPETEDAVVTLHRNIQASISTTHPFTYTVSIMDDITYNSLRKMQSCKGQYHCWYATDTHFFGANNGIIVNIIKVSLPLQGGRSDVAKGIIKLNWVADADPLRDTKPWSI